MKGLFASLEYFAWSEGCMCCSFGHFLTALLEDEKERVVMNIQLSPDMKDVFS